MVAGIMRVKNEGTFIKDCIESCIDALDELIVVHNDCTDNSVEEIDKMVAKYPDKIKKYEYPHTIKAFNLSREEFEHVRNLPEGHPQLFSTYSNFALSKTDADYAMKIDADQIYFTDKLKRLTDFMRGCSPMRITPGVIMGRLFQYYLSAFRFMSMKAKRVLPLMPSWLLRMMRPCYMSYAKYAFSHGEACMSLSGVNILDAGGKHISMGHQSDILQMLPPFNGVGDTVVFKKSDKTYFRTVVMDEYNTEDTKDYSVVEEFVHPYKRVTYIGYFWEHVRTMRPNVKEKALMAKTADAGAFVALDEFRNKSYRHIMEEASNESFHLYHRILFNFIYKAFKSELMETLKTRWK